MLQTCVLYPNTKPAAQQLFVAAAALQYAGSGSSEQKRQFRSLADGYWNDSWEPFFNNWNNVAPQVGPPSCSLTPPPFVGHAACSDQVLQAC